MDCVKNDMRVKEMDVQLIEDNGRRRRAVPIPYNVGKERRKILCN